MFKSCILIFSVLIYCLLFIYQAEAALPKDLPKTKDVKNVKAIKSNGVKDLKKATDNSSDKNIPGSAEDPQSLTENEEDTDGEKEEKADPTQNYKLIAIYLIANSPRALIKNLETPDEPEKEYRIGDFVDELQTFSISKISFNPTARVELIDMDGLSYLIKPHSVDVKSLPSTPKSPFTSMSVPTYFHGGYKSGTKKTPSNLPSTPSTSNTHSASTPAPQKEEPSKPSEPASPSQATQPTPAGALQAVSTGSSVQNNPAPQASSASAPQTNQAPGQPTPAQPADSRPVNPFQ